MVFEDAKFARLCELVCENKPNLFPSSATKEANKLQHGTWAIVTDTLNREFPTTVHTMQQVQTKWKNAKTKAKNQQQTENKVSLQMYNMKRRLHEYFLRFFERPEVVLRRIRRTQIRHLSSNISRGPRLSKVRLDIEKPLSSEKMGKTS